MAVVEDPADLRHGSSAQRGDERVSDGEALIQRVDADIDFALLDDQRRSDHEVAGPGLHGDSADEDSGEGSRAQGFMRKSFEMILAHLDHGPPTHFSGSGAPARCSPLTYG